MDDKEPTLACRVCKGSKPFSELVKRSGALLGVETLCKPCRNVQNADTRARNLERIKAAGGPRSDGEKTCSNCKECKPRTLFRPSQTTRDGRDSWCAACSIASSNAIKKRRCEANPEYREKLAAQKRDARAAMTPEQAAAERARLDAVNARLAPVREHERALRIAESLDRRMADHQAHVVAYRQSRRRRHAALTNEDLYIPPTASPNRIKKLRRQHAVRRATPAWANRAEIDAVYEAARVMTDATGVEFTVDHVVPLRHPLVCGLHVPANLFPMTRTHNSRKGNHDWPGKP